MAIVYHGSLKQVVQLRAFNLGIQTRGRFFLTLRQNSTFFHFNIIRSLVFLPGKIATINVNALSELRFRHATKKKKNTIMHAIGEIIDPSYAVIYFFYIGVKHPLVEISRKY